MFEKVEDMDVATVGNQVVERTPANNDVYSVVFSADDALGIWRGQSGSFEDISILVLKI